MKVKWKKFFFFLSRGKGIVVVGLLVKGYFVMLCVIVCYGILMGGVKVLEF